MLQTDTLRSAVGHDLSFGGPVMKTSTRKAVLLSILCGAAAFLCRSGFGASSGEDASAKRLDSPETAVRREALIAVIRQRDATIGCALRLAHEPDDGKTYWGKKECGVRLLGEMRANEAVPFLLDNIGFRPATLSFDLTEFPDLPCVEALIRIGNPAAKEIWGKRLAAADKDTLPLYLAVLKHVWGKEICTLLIEKKLKSQPPPQGLEKENLEAALKYFEKLEP